jgi:hypothetical protein
MDDNGRGPPSRPSLVVLSDAAAYMASSSSSVKGRREGDCRNGIEVDGFGGVAVVAVTGAGGGCCSAVDGDAVAGGTAVVAWEAVDVERLCVAVVEREARRA